MPFAGAIHHTAREVLGAYVSRFPESGANVVCSGNFSIEAVLSQNGYPGKITGSDVSIYSCALGWACVGRDFRLELTDDPIARELSFIEPQLVGPAEKFAAIALLLDLLPYAKRRSDYEKRLWDATVSRWGDLFAKTVERVKVKAAQVRLADFVARDAWERIGEIATGQMLLSFPPASSGGYEKLYQGLESVFSWDKPEQRGVSATDPAFSEALVNYDGHWLVCLESRKEAVEDILGEPVAQTARRRQKFAWYYTSLELPVRNISRVVSVTPSLRPRLTEDDEITHKSKLTVVRVPSSEASYLAQLYLSHRVDPAPADYNFVVQVDGKIVGVLSYSWGYGAHNCKIKVLGEQMYQQCDLAIPSVRYSRLSKLILLAAQSVEIKQALDKAMMVENAAICTTAFSTHPASMKYRGIFKLHSRKRTPEGMYSLNYFTPAGVHTLDRALVIWLKRYSKKLEKKTGDRNG